jgi:hypothetical protein
MLLGFQWVLHRLICVSEHEPSFLLLTACSSEAVTLAKGSSNLQLLRLLGSQLDSKAQELACSSAVSPYR